MVEFAILKEDFLRKFIELKNGIPSENTINRVFSAIDSNQFEQCLWNGLILYQKSPKVK